MGFSFVHISDIHLGRPFSGLSEYSFDENIQNVYKNAVKKAFNNAINSAIEKSVDFVIISGDTFDSTEHDFSSKLVLKEALNKLDSNGIKVFLICGNHDPLSSYNKNTFNYDENSDIKIIGLNTDYCTKLPVLNKNGQTEVLIHALSFKDKIFNENPIKYFENLTEEERKYFNIGILHCDLDGDKTSIYAPCTRTELEDFNYDYWALGHIHIPSRDNSNIVYPGTIQGRNTKETGPHGIRYIQVENKNIIQNTFIETNILRYEDLNIDVSTAIDDTSCCQMILDYISSIITGQTCELYLLKINLSGCINFYDCINEDFFKNVSERINLEFNHKVHVSEFNNLLIPVADKELLKNDDGISGELYRASENSDLLNDTFEEVISQLQKVIKNCCFSQDEYDTFKIKLINNVKEECLNLCAKLYSGGNKEE